MRILREKSLKTLLTTSVMILLFVSTPLFIDLASAQPAISVTLYTNKESYYIREPVIIGGEVYEYGLPSENCIVSIEARDSEDNAALYRTIMIGDPLYTWSIDVENLYLADLSGAPTDSVMINSCAEIRATIRNLQGRVLDILAMVTVLDGDSVTVYSGSLFSGSLASEGSVTLRKWICVPEWAYSGKAVLFLNIFNNLPRNGGVPYAPEAKHEFYITRNPELECPYSSLPETSSSQTGEFETWFKISPDRFTPPGIYSVYTTASPNPMFLASNSAVYSLESYPSPPQAAFTYSPLEIYANMTVTFDASASSAEGFNDTITQYEWTINDPNDPQHIVKTGNFTHPPEATIEHTFEYSDTYTVELNVTDNEGLWSTTLKPITVLPEYGPTANFTWTPMILNVNQTGTFDATSTELGWSAEIAGWPPIISYWWNFSDGIIITTGDNLTDHQYITPGNFTVTLRVTDSVGRTDSVSKIVEVKNQTRRIYDVAEPYGTIDMRDVAVVARAFGTQPGDPDWNPVADITGPTGVPDGIVDMRDVALVARHFGEEY